MWRRDILQVRPTHEKCFKMRRLLSLGRRRPWKHSSERPRMPPNRNENAVRLAERPAKKSRSGGLKRERWLERQAERPRKPRLPGRRPLLKRRPQKPLQQKRRKNVHRSRELRRRRQQQSRRPRPNTQ